MTPLLQNIVFGVFASALIGLSLVVVTARSVFRSALALTAALGTVAGLFALMGADFVAVSQLLIYVGGVMIIMLFVVMFSHEPAALQSRQTNDKWLWALLFSTAIVAGLAIQLRSVFQGVSSPAEPVPTTAGLGRLLLTDMVIPFEAVSLVLLAALVGAVYFTQEKGAPS